MNKFSLTLDDFSPRPHTNNLFWCNKLISDYPDIKIGLMVPAAYARLSDRRPFYLSENLDWVKKIKNLPDNYYICLHGMYHRRSTKDFKWHKLPESNNDEFRYLNADRTEQLIDRIENEFNAAKLNYRKVFRPAAWKISVAAAKVLTERGFLIAGDTKYYNILKDKVPNMKWISHNWDLTGTCKEQGDIIAYGHTSDWTNNYMNEERYNLIKNHLDSQEHEFRWLEEW